MNLLSSVTTLKIVNKSLQTALERLGIKTVRDLLLYVPFRYEDFSQTVEISEMQDGEQFTVCAVIELISNKRGWKKHRMVTEALVSDNSGQMRIVWWGQPYIAKNLKVGDTVFFSGKAETDAYGIVMKSPTYEKQSSGETFHTGRIVPMYSLTSGVTHKQLRFLLSQVIHLVDELPDWVPEHIRDSADVMPFGEAIRSIHFPEDYFELDIARYRFKFDELYILQLRAEMVRQSLKRHNALKVKFHETEIKEFVLSLPFELTNAQKQSAWEILKDMARATPMNRLLEGDVGSGKTIVAGLVMYNAALSGFQSAIMAPTEILATQHLKSLKQLPGKKLRIGLLTRTHTEVHNLILYENTKVGKRRELLKYIKNGEVDVLIGTHSLLSDDLEFKKLGIVVVDEQHRFGVEQRKTIREKSGDPDTHPHFLSMTATPIPRSFALTIYGDLDLSVVNEMPKGRKPIKTRVVDQRNRKKAYDFIHTHVKAGRQVFVICPIIEMNTTDGAQKKSVMEEYKKLKEDIFPGLQIDFLHGKMKIEDKDIAMAHFASGKSDILVSTSVVEVGVNIPNASIMMIEGAEHFGLAQLHQFRGRVGRSTHQSFCFLFTESKSEKVKERLEFFEKNTDGFAVAEYDLAMRGPGEVYGTNQSGVMKLRFATMKDTRVIKLARELARDINFKKYKSLMERVKEWENSVHLE